jgi:hypothetical protein
VGIASPRQTCAKPCTQPTTLNLSQEVSMQYITHHTMTCWGWNLHHGGARQSVLKKKKTRAVAEQAGIKKVSPMPYIPPPTKQSRRAWVLQKMLSRIIRSRCHCGSVVSLLDPLLRRHPSVHIHIHQSVPILRAARLAKMGGGTLRANNKTAKKARAKKIPTRVARCGWGCDIS